MSDSQAPTALKVYPPSEASMKGAYVSGMAAYQALCDKAEADYEGYWAGLAREFVSWKTPFTKVLDESQAPFFKWFEDGTLNVSYNCLDRNVEAGKGDKVAIIFEADDGKVTRVTYKQLLERTCQLANGLKSLGIKKGDRVVIYMSMSIEGVVAMQACARIGAIHSVVFGGFSAQSVRDRVQDAGAVAIITADEQLRGGKQLPLKAIVDEAIALGGCESLKNVVVYQRTGGKIAWEPSRDRWLHELMRQPAHHLRTRMGGRRAPAVPAVHQRLHRQAQGRAAQHRRLPAACGADHQVDLRPEGRRRLLVHRRHRLGHRPHLHHLRPAGAGRHRGGVRRRAHLPGRRPLLEDDPDAQGQRVLHRADGDPLADQDRRGQRGGAPEASTTCPACASWARWASPSTRPPGSGTTSTSAAAAARSSTPSGRPRPAAT